MTNLDEIEAIARRAVLAGGAELRDRYREGDEDGKFGAYDVKAAADKAAEEHMLPIVRQAFPDHAVYAEEAGEFSGNEPYRWIIDPLDGTNNFAVGLPTFASSVAVLHESYPILAAVYQPASEEMYVTVQNSGVYHEGEQVIADSDVGIEAATVVTIVGRDVPSDSELDRQANQIREALNDTVKRVLESWAPTVHSGLFARGRLQGVVQFHPDEEEQAVTELLAEESGAAIRQNGPLYVAAHNEEALSTLWEVANDAR